MQTISEIADAEMILFRHAPEYMFEFANTKEGDLVKYHSGYGMHLRNKYKLWFESPLTKNWRDNPESRNIDAGIDCSEDHPDAISMRIIEKIWELTQLESSILND